MLGNEKYVGIVLCQDATKLSSMICFDTNIIIYLGNETLSESIIGNEPIIYPSMLRIEALGYQDIRSVEEARIKTLLAALKEVPLTNTIIERAILLRQDQRMNLGDAIVAATALDSDCVLWTANSKDFAHIEGLTIHNPLAGGEE